MPLAQDPAPPTRRVGIQPRNCTLSSAPPDDDNLAISMSSPTHLCRVPASCETWPASSAILQNGGNEMDRSQDPRVTDNGFPPPLTPERVRLARERVAAIREQIRRRGVDLAQLPDPVEELIKARDAGGWE
jgi:hypothetical protein